MYIQAYPSSFMAHTPPLPHIHTRGEEGKEGRREEGRRRQWQWHFSMGCCSSLRQVSPRQKMSEGKAIEVLWMVWCLLSESTANKVIVLELPQNRYLCSLRISRTEPCSTQHLTLHGTGSSQSPMSHRAMCRLSVWCRVVSIRVPPATWPDLLLNKALERKIVLVCLIGWLV